ncbi:MAG: Gx transporter family protein [Spirochaetes bacterium]|nr:Gx transporter family protein [Spirochaetota bacterium]MCK5266957.1 Gx transporter family protein [Spirochaetota bacterium]
MSLIIQYKKAKGEKRLIFLSLFIAVSCALSIIERIIPMPVPWFKPGLANIVPLVLVMLVRYRDAVIVSVLRTFITALMIGGLFSPGHIFSFSGALVSVLVMVILHRLAGRFFSPIGISIAGAYFHSFAQLMAGWIFFLPFETVMSFAPFFFLFSIFSGFLTGTLVIKFLKTQEVLYE